VGGKTSTSTSQVQIPPEVLARYNSVNATAEQAAQNPFQQYSTNPNAFVAPITPTQSAGIQNTNAAAGMAQPYFQTGTGFALAGAGPINAQPLDTSTYMNPYLQTVLGSTEALVNQQNQQAMSGQTGNAMQQGYFGGDRSGIAAAVLAGQQMLQGGQLYSGIASDAYNQALAAAQQQQGVQLGAAQANRQALQQTGQSLAELGTGAQGAALTGAQAQLGAGQVEQQTQQAGLTALYNQFLQQQSYPFQTAQFLANIAEGTGALSGSTTTATQPGGLFMSDERLKEDMAPIGKGFDGANIYRFRYRDDPKNVTRIGFSAQEVERRHPEAIHDVGGFKAVDQGAATDEAARRGFALAANDNDGERRARQSGGMSGWGMYPGGVNPMSIAELLQAQAQMYGPYSGQGGPGLYGHSPSEIPHGGAGYVPAANMPVPQMIHGTPPPAPSQMNPLHAAAQVGEDATGLQTDVHDVHQAYDWLRAPTQNQFVNDVVAQAGAGSVPFAAGGFARAHRDIGGTINSLEQDLPQPLRTVAGGVGNLAHAIYGLSRGGRLARQDGGDLSSPQNDDPYKPQGPGLAIPTAETQHPQLQTPKPPGQQQSGMMNALGAGADLASIGSAAAKFLPMLLALRRGGRAGYAAGGGMLESLRGDLESGDNDPLEDTLLQHALAPPDFSEPEPGPGFAGAAAAPAGSAAGAPNGSGVPSAGFAGAGPPGKPAAAAATSFAGSGARPRPSADGDDTLDDNDLHRASGTTQFFQSKGWSPAAAAGITANLYAESGISANPRGPNDAGKAYGVFQAHDAYQRSFQEHMGKPMQGSSLKDQEEFLHWDLTEGPDKAVGARMSAAKTPEEASRIFMLGIERPRDQSASAVAGRQAIARQIAAGKRARGGFARARRGFQTDGFVGGNDDDILSATDIAERRDRPTGDAPQVDPAIVAQANPQLAQQVIANRQLAAAGDPRAPPAAQAAVAGDASTAVSAQAPPPPAPDTSVGNQLTPTAPPGQARDFSAANQSTAPAPQPTGDDAGGQGPGGARYLTDSERRNEMAQDYYASEVQRQRGPQGGGFLGMLQRNWIPLAQGFAAMEAAPTRNPLVALSQGAGAFATGEQAQRQYQLGQARTLAELAQTGENVETGAYQGQTARTRVGLDALNAAMPAFEQQFRPLNDTKNGERAYQDLRPGHAGQILGESEVNGLRQDFRLRMLTGAGLPTGLIAPIAGMAGGSQPGAPSDRTTASPSGGLSGSAIAARNPAGPPADVHGGAGTGVGTGDGSDRAVAPPAATPQGSGSQGHGATADGKSAPAESAGAGAATPEQRAVSGAYKQVPVDVQEPDPTNLNLADGDNPDALYRDYQAGASVGLDVGWKRDRADAIRGATADAPGPILHDKNGNVVPNPYVDYNLARHRQSAMSDAAVETQKQNQAAASAWLGRDPQVRQLLHTIDESFGSGDPTIMSGKFADIISEMDTNPWLRDHIPKSMRDAVTSGTLAEKAAALQDIDTLIQGGMGGAPATGLHTAHHATAAPSSPAGTAYTIAHQRWENYLYAQAHQQFVANYSNTIGDWTKANNEWTRYNRGRFYDAATEAMAQDIGGTGYFHRMTPKDMKQFPRTWQGEDVAKTWAPGTYFRRPNGALGRVPGGPPE
jgi:Phage tail lysozyme/Chaperone of endosialidase